MDEVLRLVEATTILKAFEPEVCQGPTGEHLDIKTVLRQKRWSRTAWTGF